MAAIEGIREPRALVERAAASAIEEAQRVLVEGGAELAEAFLVVSALNVPAGEFDATSTGAGFADELELLSYMVGSTVEQAARLGFTLDVELKGSPVSDFVWKQSG